MPIRAECSAPTTCGDLVSVNCGAERDGPLDYYDNRTGELVMACGGACYADKPGGKVCVQCPPKEWTCR